MKMYQNYCKNEKQYYLSFWKVSDLYTPAINFWQ